MERHGEARMKERANSRLHWRAVQLSRMEIRRIRSSGCESEQPQPRQQPSNTHHTIGVAPWRMRNIHTVFLPSSY
eukprot:3935141-Rhodomonas_salina.1